MLRIATLLLLAASLGGCSSLEGGLQVHAIAVFDAEPGYDGGDCALEATHSSATFTGDPVRSEVFSTVRVYLAAAASCNETAALVATATTITDGGIVIEELEPYRVTKAQPLEVTALLFQRITIAQEQGDALAPVGVLRWEVITSSAP